MNQLFPLGLATGSAFCNRDDERAWLTDNLQHCRHSLLMSPRRYGKTSLAHQVFLEQKITYSKFDFLLASDDISIQDEILSGVGKLISNLLPVHIRTFEKVKKYMASLRPEFILNDEGFKIEFNPRSNAKTTILETLEQLEKLATKEKLKVVLFMDEFQQIGSIKNNKIIEAAIRHAAERSKYVCYVFSGSNRHLLADMFQDDERPLYRLCDEIHLKRINVIDYQLHLQKAAKKKWKVKLNELIIDKILELTQRHPYYVNQLCARYWRYDKMPGIGELEIIWSSFCVEQERRLHNTLSNLSPNQRGVFKVIARYPTKTPSSKENIMKARLSNASFSQALKVLRSNDLIFVDDAGVTRLLDPMMEYILHGQD